MLARNILNCHHHITGAILSAKSRLSDNEYSWHCHTQCRSRGVFQRSWQYRKLALTWVCVLEGEENYIPHPTSSVPSGQSGNPSQTSGFSTQNPSPQENWKGSQVGAGWTRINDRGVDQCRLHNYAHDWTLSFVYFSWQQPSKELGNRSGTPESSFQHTEWHISCLVCSFSTVCQKVARLDLWGALYSRTKQLLKARAVAQEKVSKMLQLTTSTHYTVNAYHPGNYIIYMMHFKALVPRLSVICDLLP